MKTADLESPNGFFKLFFLLLLLLIVGAGYVIYKRYGTLDLTFIERTPPVTKLPVSLTGIGADATTIEIPVSDEGAGLDEVIVRIEQNGKRQEIFKKNTYPTGVPTHEDIVSFQIKGKDLGIREGTVKLLVSAFDRSFWNNGTHQEIELPVSYGKPKLEVLTAQHNVSIAGAELVFYKIKGSHIALSGVRVRDSMIFPGYPASELDPAFKGFPNVYFAMFALPIDFNKDKERLTVFAKDIIGNSGTSTMNYLVLPRKFKSPEMNLSDDFLRTKFDELLPPYYDLSKAKAETIDYDSMSDADRIAKFRLINETYRGLLQDIIKNADSNPEHQRLWEIPFIRPLAAAPTSAFGETRSYTLRGQSAGGSLHAGMDLADKANAVAFAANHGKVIFADFLGIYGNTVIIDHGFGLTSLYGHLSSIAVSVGENVRKGQQLGRTGMTGLAGGDHLHFEIRLNGVPITPIEWWDEHWIRDHIENKIAGMKEQLAAQSALDRAVSQ